MFDNIQFREQIIRPALEGLYLFQKPNPVDLYTKDSEELLVAVMATESLGGKYLTQKKGGPARGIYQMEERTYENLWKDYLFPSNEAKIRVLISSVFKAINYLPNCSSDGGLTTVSSCPDASRMVWDLRYATIMARLFFVQFSDVIPRYDDLEGIWEIYKKHWNTEKGKTTRDEFFVNYRSFVHGG